MLSLYNISAEPDRKISKKFEVGLVDEENDVRTVLDAYMDHDIIVMLVACETSGFKIETYNFSTKCSMRLDLGAFSTLGPFVWSLRFHYLNGLICIGASNAPIKYINIISEYLSTFCI